MTKTQRDMLFLALEWLGNAVFVVGFIAGLVALKCWIDPA